MNGRNWTLTIFTIDLICWNGLETVVPEALILSPAKKKKRSVDSLQVNVYFESQNWKRRINHSTESDSAE
jgi:hypothetical protein